MGERSRRLSIWLFLFAVCFAAASINGCADGKESVPIGDGFHNFCLIPAGSGNSFFMGEREVTVGEYAAYMNDTVCTNDFSHPQLRRNKKGYKARRKLKHYPVAFITRTEAESFCRWLSDNSGRKVRLPTTDEWEYAARGGIRGAHFPWGWGIPEENARFNTDAACAVGRFEPNPYGLYDMAGNVYEWCAKSSNECVIAMGGSWAERSKEMLYVDRRAAFPSGYRDADAGFRILVEYPDGKAQQETEL